VVRRFLQPTAGRTGGALVVLAAVAALAGCGGDQPPSAPGGGPATSTPASAGASPSGSRAGADGSTTSRSAPYATTTCAQWTTKLSQAKRTAAARTLLSRERERDGATGKPPSRLVATFERDVTQACAGDRKSTIAETADAVYQIAHKDFAPAK
jgi:hypothetical protein